MEGRPRILMLHGVLSGRATWTAVRAELNDEAVTLAPDLLGNGHSIAARDLYGLDAVVDHLTPLVERFRPTHVLGHSMGGIVALALRARMPNRFERVGLIGLPVFPDRETAMAYLAQRGRFVRGILRDHRRAHLLCIAATRLGPMSPALLGRLYPALPRDVLRATFDHRSAAHGRALDEIVFAGMVPELAHQPGGSPVTMLHGGRDRAAPLEPARELAEAFGFGFTTVPDANHQAVIERADEVAAWMRTHVLRSNG
jgi:pimeloyl-ACP methyl ester carboxylesterase